MTLPPITRAQKNPRWAGWFGKIGASNESAANASSGDFRNPVNEEPKMQRIYLSARARVCHPPVRRPSMLAFLSGGVA